MADPDREHSFDHAARQARRIAVPERVQRRHLDLLQQVRSDRHLGRRRPRALAIGVGVALASSLGVGTAATLGAFTEEPTVVSTAYCFASTAAALEGQRIEFMIGQEYDVDRDDSVGNAAKAALDVCRNEWLIGALLPDGTVDPMANGQDRPVPRLVACVIASGHVGVFPLDAGDCAAIGLPDALVP